MQRGADSGAHHVRVLRACEPSAGGGARPLPQADRPAQTVQLEDLPADPRHVPVDVLFVATSGPSAQCTVHTAKRILSYC